jgi:hypothetical protein
MTPAPRSEARPRPQLRPGVGPLTFRRLKWVSFTHSCIYTALLVCAFVVSKPEPLTFVLGMSHGLLWIGMSLTCIVCARLRIVSLRLAVAVAVLGGVGPFFGSYEFVREQRRRTAGGGGAPGHDDPVGASDASCDDAATDVVGIS